jgi:hypothetical protein
MLLKWTDMACTAFFWSAQNGYIRIMQYLLTEEGGSSLAERSVHVAQAFSAAARGGRYRAMQCLLEEHGSSIAAIDDRGRSAWMLLLAGLTGWRHDPVLLSLLKVMLMIENAPADFIAGITPDYAELCTRGNTIWAQLPIRVEQQRAAVVANCTLPAVLQSLVTAYAVTTLEDLWTESDRLRVKPRVKGPARARPVSETQDLEESGGAPPLHRSRRLRQKRA